MRLTDIRPFVRYVHFLPINISCSYGRSVPYDNRLFYVYSGTARMKILDITYTLMQGDAVIIPSGSHYELIADEKTVTYIGVNFDYTQSHANMENPVPPMYRGSFKPDMRFEALTFSDAEELNGTAIVRGLGSVSGKLIALEKEYSEKRFSFELASSNILTEILIECVRLLRKQRLGSGNDTAKKVLAYVEEHFSEPLSNKSIADVFGLHQNYVSHLVKCYTGMPLHQYLIHTRISHSMKLLSARELSVGEIAAQSGFVDIYHFSKAFKRIAGIAPSKYL